MIRREALPSYHFEVNTDGVIKDPAEMKLRDYTVMGNCGKNLIQYPYQTITPEAPYTTNGITFTDNGDGSITVNGTCDENEPAMLSLVPKLSIAFDKKYVLTGTSESAHVLLCLSKDGSWVHEFWVAWGQPVVCDFPQYDFDTAYIVLYVGAGATIDNATAKPMLELGEEATEWEPYKSVGDVCDTGYEIPIKNSGKNLIPYPYARLNPDGREGITITDNGDGSLTIDGENLSSSSCIIDFYWCPNWTIGSGIPVDGVYTLSFNIISGSYVNNEENNGAHMDMYINGAWRCMLSPGERGTFNLSGEVTLLRCFISKGAVFDRLTVAVQMEKGSSATEFELYREAVTATVPIPQPLKDGESISARADGLPDIPLFKGTNILTVETEVAPEGAEYQYYTY